MWSAEGSSVSVDVRQTFDISEQTQLNHPLGTRRGSRRLQWARGCTGARGGARRGAAAACEHTPARSVSFYSHYLLTFELNGVALLKFKQNDYRRNGIKLGYRNEKTVFEWPSLSSRRSNRNSKHLAEVARIRKLLVSLAERTKCARQKRIDIGTRSYRRIVIVLGRNGTK